MISGGKRGGDGNGMEWNGYGCDDQKKDLSLLLTYLLTAFASFNGAFIV